MHYTFDQVMAHAGLPPLRRRDTQTLQVNLGKRCNQACRHCHVDASPNRTEAASDEVIERILWLLNRTPEVTTVDITGGAPELHPSFRRLVARARAMGRHVMDRCNLTVLQLPDQLTTASFLAENKVEIVASLPCYGPENVDQQRGTGVFDQSIRALQQLNELGYGAPESDLKLNLVYNPIGPFLPPSQAALEAAYRERLKVDFGISFNALFTLTNMPIARFRTDLQRQHKLDGYLALLAGAFNPKAAENVMCRTTLSVSWDGRLYDCDFNQMLELGSSRTIWDIDRLTAVDGDRIMVGHHCLGCTAGAGSSCGGALDG